MKASVTVIIIIFLIFTGVLTVQAEQDVRPILEELIEEAVANNPELLAFKENTDAYKEKIPQARSLADPRLRMSIINLPADTYKFDQEPMTQKQVAIMQKFPFPGKLKLKGNAAEKGLDMVKAEYEEKKNHLIMQVKVTFQNLLFINRAIEITGKNRDILRALVKITETKYAVGKGIQHDVLKAQVELSKITNRLILLKQKKQTTEAFLNALLSRPALTPFIDSAEIGQTGSDLIFEDLQKISEENRPVLAGLKHLIDQQHITYRLAKKDYYPDFDVGLSYGQRDHAAMMERPDFVSAFITINIPLWYATKESRNVAEKKADIRRAKEQFNSMRNYVDYQIRNIMAEIERYDQEIELFRTGLLPQGRLSLESAIAGYKTNKVDFLSVVNNQITLYKFEIDYYQAIVDHENKLAELEMVVGQRLF